MSHEITASDGMFTVRTAAWHSLGHVFNDYPKRKEAQAIAHPWEPVERPLFRPVYELDENGEFITGPDGELQIERFKKVEGFKANVRSDNDFDLGVVSEDFTNVLNSELWDIGEALETSGDDVMFETAGSLKGGKKVWLLIRLKDPIMVNGDPHGATIPYFALQNGHDGSSAFRGQATVTRIVCANTAHVADMEASARGTEFAFKHTTNVGERIEQAKDALAGWRESIEAWRMQSEYLLSERVSPLDSQKFLERFISMPPKGSVSERVESNVERERAKWLEFYNSVTGEGLKGTAYGLVQASVEYAQWGRRAHNTESLFQRTFLDKSSIIAKAVEWSLEAAAESR